MTLRWECSECGNTKMSSMRGGKCGQCNTLALPVEERHCCPTCGLWVETARYPVECFSCAYWEGQITRGNNVVIDGVHYRVDFAKPIKNDRNPDNLGMAGRKFRIRMLDGREVVTNDLWYQGPIPPEFRPRLPDNAEFVDL